MRGIHAPGPLLHHRNARWAPQRHAQNYQKRACQWDEQEHARERAKQRSNPLGCRTSNLPPLFPTLMKTASIRSLTFRELWELYYGSYIVTMADSLQVM